MWKVVELSKKVKFDPFSGEGEHEILPVYYRKTLCPDKMKHHFRTLNFKICFIFHFFSFFIPNSLFNRKSLSNLSSHSQSTCAHKMLQVISPIHAEFSKVNNCTKYPLHPKIYVHISIHVCSQI